MVKLIEGKRANKSKKKDKTNGEIFLEKGPKNVQEKYIKITKGKEQKNEENKKIVEKRAKKFKKKSDKKRKINR